MTYERTLLDIDEENRGYAHCLLQCIAVASRPLRIEELAEFLAINFDAGSIPTLVADWRPENPGNAVLSTCSSLITVVTVDGLPVVQFSHFSVQEFLMSSRLASGLLSHYHISLKPAHTIVAQVCLSVLLQLDNHIDKTTISKYPLAHYAAQYWVDHAKFQNVASRVQELMMHVFDRGRPHFAAWVWVYDRDQSRRSMDSETPSQPTAPPIYYAALWDLPCMAEWLATTRAQDMNEQGGHYGTPLCAAAARGCLKVAQMLVKCGVHVDTAGGNGWSPLLWASDSGCLELSRLMLDHGADINFRDSSSRTPLSLATGKGLLEIARFLLQRGADVNVWQRGEGTVLIKALEREDIVFAEFLLPYGANVNAEDCDGLSLLHKASGHRNLVSVRWLLERDARFLPRNKRGWIPFPEEGDHRTVASLLSSIYSLCFSFCFQCIVNPNGRIHLPDVEEGEPQDASIGMTPKRRALLVGISYMQSDSIWYPLYDPHPNVDMFMDILVGE